MKLDTIIHIHRDIRAVALALIVAVVFAGCGTARRTVGGVSSPAQVVVPEKSKPQKPTKRYGKGGWWGDINHKGEAWVTPVSRPNKISRGLDGRHISLWASHGRYYKHSTGRWEWQRPNLFCTNEDLFTQTFVVPYLIPMLENAGAVVFTPRERSWQVNEFIVDNDEGKGYLEVGKWETTGKKGFAMPEGGVLRDGDLPFENGTARVASTSKGDASSFIEYTPKLTEEGDYAVYVSYQTVDGSVDDAHYTVFHAGQQTEFCVNQQMGGGTWVYLGTFHFTADERALNCVVLDNHSSHHGKVTADAVRFGGGMGNVARGGTEGTLITSGLPRADEGARYYCQWAGAPYGVYSQRGGTDDYADDINCRSMMTNWLAGGSCYEPDTVGLRVPIELTLAFHSDAGYAPDNRSIYGSLGICTTDFNDGKLATGMPRSHSRELVDTLLNGVMRDLKAVYGKWNVRDIYDRNYSETRRPEVPSAILEMLSHQSFPDMQLAHDPHFKFNLARAIYKSVLRYIATAHGEKYVVAPLAPRAFCTSMTQEGQLNISWDAVYDPIEPTAAPTAFKLYVARDDGGYDNGRVVKSNNVSLQLEPAHLYRLRVTAINDGGESLPTEELAAVYRPGAPQVMVANGFHRLAAPQVVDGGFDITLDPGLSYGKTPAWVGNQQEYDFAKSGEGPGTYGYSGNEMAGTYVAGNDFNYVAAHVEAIAASGLYSAVSCDASVLPRYTSLEGYRMLDVILGNERNDGYSLTPAEALPQQLRNVLAGYNGGVFVSGSYIASDTQDDDGRQFLANRLNVAYNTQNRSDDMWIHGMGMEFSAYRKINEKHYASTASDVLSPVNGGFAVLAYADGGVAAVASNKAFVMGFPFECIKERSVRNTIMASVLNYLSKY